MKIIKSMWVEENTKMKKKVDKAICEDYKVQLRKGKVEKNPKTPKEYHEYGNLDCNKSVTY